MKNSWIFQEVDVFLLSESNNLSWGWIEVFLRLWLGIAPEICLLYVTHKGKTGRKRKGHLKDGHEYESPYALSLGLDYGVLDE